MRKRKSGCFPRRSSAPVKTFPPRERHSSTVPMNVRSKCDIGAT